LIEFPTFSLRADRPVLILVVEGVLLFSLKIAGIRSAAVLLRSARGAARRGAERGKNIPVPA